MKICKHNLELRYELEVLDKLEAPKKRWIIIEFCTECDYQQARDVTYINPEAK